MVEGDGSYFDQSFCLVSPRLGHVLVAKLVWTPELVENDSLQFCSLFLRNTPVDGPHRSPLDPTCPYLVRTRCKHHFLEVTQSLNSQEQAESEKVAAELKGNTLRVYWYVMNANKQTVGVRE